MKTYGYTKNSNIVPSDKFDAAILMEDCVKGDLLELLDNQDQEHTQEDINRFTKFAYGSLHALQESKIFHDDIKPENIVITADGHFKLCDFRFSKFADHSKFELSKLFHHYTQKNSRDKSYFCKERAFHTNAHSH